MAQVGQLSLYLFSYQLISGAMTVLQRIIKVPVLTYFSCERIQKSNVKTQTKIFNTLFLKALFVCTGLFSLFILIGDTLLILAPEFGSINADNIYDIWLNASLLFGVFIGGVLAYITTSIYHAYGYTKLLARISMINFTIMMPIKITSFVLYGVVGLALSTSLYFISSIVSQRFFILKRIFK
jgi:hypothetical protein